MPHPKHISEIYWCKIIHKLKIQDSSWFECVGQINKTCTPARSDGQREAED
jgi:hypothetical protein